jgi:hypothetical protein
MTLTLTKVAKYAWLQMLMNNNANNHKEIYRFIMFNKVKMKSKELIF